MNVWAGAIDFINVPDVERRH